MLLVWILIIFNTFAHPFISSYMKINFSPQPGPRGSLIQCYIKWNRTNQTYHLYFGLIQASTDDGKFLLAAWNCRCPTFTDDIISLNAGDVWKGSTTYIGKLRYVYMLYEVAHGIYCFTFFFFFFLFLIVLIPFCSSTLFAERLITFACVERIFFLGRFK
ncbi:hypothetical protein VitviT2T_010386 [Vitis vinifera]|uniref:Tubby C-terminal domain-containing protein n=2 Tax=Vitis vinifera TaxID=29760 RepID=D7TRE2_VITVI